MTNKSFGDDNGSSYIETPIGIVFSGDLKNMQNNLHTLPSRCNVFSCTSNDAAVVLNPKPLNHSSFSSPSTIETEVVSCFVGSVSSNETWKETTMKLKPHNNDFSISQQVRDSSNNDFSPFPQVQSTSYNECFISPKVNFSHTNDIALFSKGTRYFY